MNTIGMPPQPDQWNLLLSSGQIVEATGDDSILDELPIDYGIDASGRLAWMRSGER
jgi:hypothetical protein